MEEKRDEQEESSRRSLAVGITLGRNFISWFPRYFYRRSPFIPLATAACTRISGARGESSPVALLPARVDRPHRCPPSSSSAHETPPALALRRVSWTLSRCRYHSRVLNPQQRRYLAKPEMAVSKWSTSVISALSSDTEPTIIITFDNAKYIFNAGENTGRAWMQSRAHWRRMKALFFTQVGTQRMSGMPGTAPPPTR